MSMAVAVKPLARSVSVGLAPTPCSNGPCGVKDAAPQGSAEDMHFACHLIAEIMVRSIALTTERQQGSY